MEGKRVRREGESGGKDEKDKEGKRWWTNKKIKGVKNEGAHERREGGGG